MLIVNAKMPQSYGMDCGGQMVEREGNRGVGRAQVLIVIMPDERGNRFSLRRCDAIDVGGIADAGALNVLHFHEVTAIEADAFALQFPEHSEHVQNGLVNPIGRQFPVAREERRFVERQTTM